MTNNIDFNNWKDFKISDIFITNYIHNKLQVPTGASVKKKDLIEGDIPRITVTGINNGIFGYYQENKKDANYRVYENFISVSFLGTVFYQIGKASLDMKVHCLKPLTVELNRYTGLFLVNTIYSSLRNSSYSDQISSTLLPNLMIRLPINSSGLPDWEFMETYMKDIETRTKTKQSELFKILDTDDKTSINIDNWKEFMIGDLFEIQLAQGDLQATKQNEGIIPLVSSGMGNNGICKFIEETNKSKMFNPGTITVDMFGKTFYQNNKFYAVGHGRVNMLILKLNFQLNEYQGTFIATIIEKITNAKYKFNDMCSSSALAKEIIKLPITKMGEPDWDYMETYMKNIENKVNHSLSAIAQII